MSEEKSYEPSQKKLTDAVAEGDHYSSQTLQLAITSFIALLFFIPFYWQMSESVSGLVLTASSAEIIKTSPEQVWDKVMYYFRPVVIWLLSFLVTVVATRILLHFISRHFQFSPKFRLGLHKVFRWKNVFFNGVEVWFQKSNLFLLLSGVFLALTMIFLLGFIFPAGSSLDEFGDADVLEAFALIFVVGLVFIISLLGVLDFLLKKKEFHERNKMTELEKREELRNSSRTKGFY